VAREENASSILSNTNEKCLMVDVESFENNVSIYGFEIESNYD